jgi:transcriptional regulator with XRE-family HTH domain
MDINPATLRRLREDKGYTQPTLAKKARITYSYVSKLEYAAKSNPSPEVVKRLARALGVEIPVLRLEPEAAVAWVAEQAQVERRDAAAESASTTSEPVSSSSKATDGWPW